MNTAALPPGYTCKRNTVITFCCIQILGFIAVAALSSPLTTATVKAQHPSDPEKFHTIYMITFIVVGITGIVFELFGLIGAIKENHCLTMTFVVLQCLSTIYAVFNAISMATYWSHVVWSLIFTTVSILFLLDLRKIRFAQQTQQAQTRAYYA